MVAYADYEFYKLVHHGQMKEEDFNRHIIKASAYIRKITFGRAEDHTESDAVKLSACAVCDLYEKDERQRARYQGQNITSESNDGYSVSFAPEQMSGETAEELLERKAYQAAELFLLPEGLLYLGVQE